jgi:tRNA-splicing ligase RtcB (3'-phosphate/5'-hydroxy nucleic acid ligase)
MSKLKLTGKQIRAIGYPEGPVVSVAMHQMSTHFKHSSEEEALSTLANILATPEKYLADEQLSKIAEKLIVQPDEAEKEIIALKEEGVQYNIFGAEHIEEGALKQMQIAAKLPVAVAGALMPDAHQGYGLPIGGVLATENAIIPYAVGVDIGCRMCLSVFDIPAQALRDKTAFLQRELVAHTLFGAGRDFNTKEHRSGMTDNEVLADPLFKEIELLKTLHNKAANQLGSSGSGNHFVEFGEVIIENFDNTWGLAPGNYVGLLSHSGSRGLGATIAGHYTKLAMEKTVLPNEAKHLAWLDMNTAEGVEYWLAMNLAGNYASACHHTIHAKIANAIGEKPISVVENHHNFAWKEIWNGKEVFVHRKGATPAAKNVMGIIPGSMTAPGFIVKGKGEVASINSASHGAGRQMSRTKAIANLNQELLKKTLREHGVTLLGGGLDEAPQAYKNIEHVMQSQNTLVHVLGKFIPKIVQMDGSAAKTFRKKRDKGEGVSDGE